MIYAVKVRCASCYSDRVLFLGENARIKTPYVCAQCFKVKSVDDVKKQRYEIAVQSDLQYENFFMGYKTIPKLYIPTVRIKEKVKEKEMN